MDYRITIELPDDEDRDAIFEAVADAVYELTQDAAVSGAPVSDNAVGRLFGRQENMPPGGSVLCSLRIVSGSIPGGPDGIGKHYELIPNGEES